MMTYGMLPPLVRALLMLWTCGLLYIIAWIVTRLIQVHARRRQYVIAIVLGIFCYLFMQAQISVMHSLTGKAVPHRVAELMYGCPLPAAVLLFLLVSALTGALAWRVWDWQKHHISAMSVKQGVDALPVGIMYYWKNGLIKLMNREMGEIALRLSGQSLQDGVLFERMLREGKGVPGVRYIRLAQAGGEGQENAADPEADGAILVHMPTGEVYSFRTGSVRLDGNTFSELLAFDVTEQYMISRALEEDNRKLLLMNRRLRRLSSMISEVSKEQEILAAKIRIHDETGRIMLATRRYLSEEMDPEKRQELLEIWQKSRLLYLDSGIGDGPGQNGGEGTAEEDPFLDLRAAAEAVGIRLHIEGSLPPGQKKAEMLLTAGARECLTNAFRHGAANELDIRIKADADSIIIEYSNDGRPPEEEIREGGGLTSLRRLVASKGGRMEIESRPAFVLRIYAAME